MDVSIICSIDRVGAHKDDAVDNILVCADANTLNDYFTKTLTLKTSLSGDFFSAVAEDNDKLANQLAHLFPHGSDAFGSDYLSDKDWTWMLFLIGHGLSPTPIPDGVSGTPRIFPYQPYRNRRDLSGGDLFCHLYGFLGYETVLHIARERLENTHNKHIVIVSDLCFSSSWCDKFTDNIRDIKAKLGEDCHITIQASAKQHAYGSVFVPTLIALQNDTLRERWLGEYNEAKEKGWSCDDALTIQEPCLSTTLPVPVMPVFECKNVGKPPGPPSSKRLKGESRPCFWLFADPSFFWFCAQSLCPSPDRIGHLMIPRVVFGDSAARLLQRYQRNEMTLQPTAKLSRTFDKTSPYYEAYLAIYWYSYDNSSREVELHVHYRDSKGGPKTPTRFNFFEYDARNLTVKRGNSFQECVFPGQPCFPGIEKMAAEALEMVRSKINVLDESSWNNHKGDWDLNGTHKALTLALSKAHARRRPLPEEFRNDAFWKLQRRLETDFCHQIKENPSSGRLNPAKFMVEIFMGLTTIAAPETAALTTSTAAATTTAAPATSAPTSTTAAPSTTTAAQKTTTYPDQRGANEPPINSNTLYKEFLSFWNITDKDVTINAFTRHREQHQLQQLT